MYMIHSAPEGTETRLEMWRALIDAKNAGKGAGLFLGAAVFGAYGFGVLLLALACGLSIAAYTISDGLGIRADSVGGSSAGSVATA